MEDKKNFNIIKEGSSIILSYNFLYEEASVQAGMEDGSITDNDLEYENLLNYVDRLYEKNKIFRYKDIDGQKLYLYDEDKSESYELEIDEVYVLFFEDNMAFLNIKLTYEGSELDTLYKINKHLTTFYSQKNQTQVAVGNNHMHRLSFSVDTFKSIVEKYYPKHLEVLSEEIQSFEEQKKKFFANKKYNYKIVIDKGAPCIKLTVDPLNNLHEHFIELSNTCVYPFDTKIESTDMQHFKCRVGPTISEKDEITIQSKDSYKVNDKTNQHYLFFEKQQELNEKTQKDEHKVRYIDYNTFITSLIVKYVKPNDGVFFYDNFNFIATNYINSYITLFCDSESINNAVEDNFLHFEPLVSSKTKKGKKITNPDFFKIFQSQSDMFTIGNSHNIVHILDDTIDTAIKERKLSDHFYTYQLTQLQRNTMLRIITSSILNINDVASEKSFMQSICHPVKAYKSLKEKSQYSWKTFVWIHKSVENFRIYLTNINFSIISNSSSIDNSYQFFRECNEVNILTSQWGSISEKLKDSKSIMNFILNEYKIVILILSSIITTAILLYNFKDILIKIGSYIF